MNINWDEELAEFLNETYLKSWKKISPAKYQFTTLEGTEIVFSCSEEGYRCSCHDEVFEIPNTMLRQHSPKYVEAFNS